MVVPEIKDVVDLYHELLADTSLAGVLQRLHYAHLADYSKPGLHGTLVWKITGRHDQDKVEIKVYQIDSSTGSPQRNGSL